MRELLFRVYDPNVGSVIASEVGIDKIYLYDFEGDNITEQEGLVVVQYTGLKDKNGTPIYEGDILRVIDDGIQTNDLGIQVVEFKDYYIKPFANIQKGGRQQSTWHEMGFSFEVIGNIYEDGDLLENPKS